MRRADLDVRLESRGGDVIVLAASGRPSAWAKQVTKQLVCNSNQSRGHIVAWSTQLRAFVNRVGGSRKKLMELIGVGGNPGNQQLQHDTYEYLKALYNTIANIAVNDTAQDNDAGALANNAAQALEFAQEWERPKLLKTVFQWSFNPSKSDPAKNLAQTLPGYLETFSVAWGVQPKILIDWAMELGWMQPTKVEKELPIIIREQKISQQPSRTLHPVTPVETTGGVYPGLVPNAVDLQVGDPKWIREAFDEFASSNARVFLEELRQMILSNYEHAPTLRDYYDFYLQKINALL